MENNTLRDAIKTLEKINNLFNHHPSYEKDWEGQREYRVWKGSLKDLIMYIHFFLTSIGVNREGIKEEITALRQRIGELEREYPYLKGTLEELKEKEQIIKDYLTTVQLLEKGDKGLKEALDQVLLHGDWNKRFLPTDESQQLVQIHRELQGKIEEAQDLLKEEDRIMKKLLSSFSGEMQKIKELI